MKRGGRRKKKRDKKDKNTERQYFFPYDLGAFKDIPCENVAYV